MALPEAVSRQYQTQAQIAATTAASVRSLAMRMGSDFDTGWAAVRDSVLAVAQAGRSETVQTALPYVSSVLAETGQASAPYGELVAARFIADAPDGRSMESLVDLTPIRAKAAVAGGAADTVAVQQAASWLSGTMLTVLADTRRDVYSVDIAQNLAVTGYVRMLQPPSCGRCVILAGKWFRWNEGFRRHPRCDCIHIPASENVAGSYTTDPYAYFRSLTETDQARLFGKREAEAIRDHGADIYRVMNVKTRGLGTAKSNRIYGTPNRRTVSDIIARDPERKFVLQNLEYHGYITGPQRAGGNLIGNGPAAERFAGMTRGRGTYRVGGQTVKTARASVIDARAAGVRDPLNRSTMTAAERRLYDAHYRLQYARRNGSIPNSIGANSADVYTTQRPATPAAIAELEREWLRQVELARQSPAKSVRGLLDLLTA